MAITWLTHMFFSLITLLYYQFIITEYLYLQWHLPFVTPLSPDASSGTLYISCWRLYDMCLWPSDGIRPDGYRFVMAKLLVVKRKYSLSPLCDDNTPGIPHYNEISRTQSFIHNIRPRRIHVISIFLPHALLPHTGMLSYGFWVHTVRAIHVIVLFWGKK